MDKMSNLNFQLQKPKENGTEYLESKTKATPIAMVAPELKHTEADTEISRTCAVMGCEDYKNFEQESFFRFPEDSKSRQIWAELTGRHDWTPTDYSYICYRHFSADSFMCDADGNLVLTNNAVPSVKLPKHVFEVEYIDEETLENDGLENGNDEDYDMEMDYIEDEEEAVFNKLSKEHRQNGPSNNVEVLQLFTEVQKMQRQAVGLKDKLRCNSKLFIQQSRYLQRLKDSIEIKKNILNQKKKKKSRILLSIQDKIKEDRNGLVLAMPVRHTDDLKNFALSIYKYSPQAYIYARNTLRTMLPSSDVLESWLKSGFQPKNVLSNDGVVKVVAEQTETELTCKVTLH